PGLASIAEENERAPVRHGGSDDQLDTGVERKRVPHLRRVVAGGGGKVELRGRGNRIDRAEEPAPSDGVQYEPRVLWRGSVERRFHDGAHRKLAERRFVGGDSRQE